MKELREAANDGLITAYLEEENWGVAHRVLMPAFGPGAVRGMFDDMHDIATQLALKWARLGKNEPFTPSEDFTRLAMDTLALCSMDYRFNSFYSTETHPFLQAMARVLRTSRYRARRPNNVVSNLYYRNENKQYFEDIAYLRKVSDDIVTHRASHSTERRDLVAAMQNNADPQTGKHMTDKSTTDNALSFLVAGHETTSGLLSFTLYYLVKHPEVWKKAQKEVDSILRKGQMNVDQLSKLPYVTAILRETLRLEPPLPVFAVKPYEDTIIANKYLVKKDESCVILLKSAHLDKAVFGEDSDKFRPERMLDENFNKLPPGCFKPFGNGMRACIGRLFALQEATLMLAMLLQNFDIELDDPAYEIQYNQTLTVKPKDFKIRAHLRDGLTPNALQHRLMGTRDGSLANGTVNSNKAASAIANAQPLTILYGSNSGTCESLAQALASHAPSRGFRAVTVKTLDAAARHLPRDHPVVIITTSYEGQPTDDARDFVSWLEEVDIGGSLTNIKYSVYGLGHHDWVSTFHRIPRHIDVKLAEGGAKRLLPLALTDVGSSEIFSSFEAWEEESFWLALQKEYGVKGDSASDGAGVTVDMLSPRMTTLRHHVSEAMVTDAQVLTAPGEPVKRSIEIQLPSEMSYRAGDCLSVLPVNPSETVARVLRRFQLPRDVHVKITADHRTPLPTDNPVALADILGAYVELNQPATKRGISVLIQATKDVKTKGELQKISSDLFTSEIFEKHTSILDLLERFPRVELPLASFLAVLPPMRVRRYSISSSPLFKAGNATLTYSVLNFTSKSRDGRHLGVATSYLESLQKGDKLRVAVRQSHGAFGLPGDAESTPIVMVAAGSGLAPFRGFIQERAADITAGRNVAPAVLFFGCREPGKDDLYAKELATWEKAGAVKVYRAYSRTPGKAGGHKYVQETLLTERSMVNELWRDDARFYICGSRDLGHDVTHTMVKILHGSAETPAHVNTEEDAMKWWESLRNVRYAIDVFD